MVTLILLLLVIPATLIWIMIQKKDQLIYNSTDVYCTLYAGIKTNSVNTKSMNLLFILRRVLIIAIIFYQLPQFQLLSVQILNLFMSMYFCSSQRVTNSVVHKQIVFNEFCLMMQVICLIFYTQQIDTEWLTTLGWVFIIINMVMIGGNMPLVIFFGVRKIFIVARFNFKRAGIYISRAKRWVNLKLNLGENPQVE